MSGGEFPIISFILASSFAAAVNHLTLAERNGNVRLETNCKHDMSWNPKPHFPRAILEAGQDQRCSYKCCDALTKLCNQTAGLLQIHFVYSFSHCRKQCVRVRDQTAVVTLPLAQELLIPSSQPVCTLTCCCVRHLSFLFSNSSACLN